MLSRELSLVVIFSLVLTGCGGAAPQETAPVFTEPPSVETELPDAGLTGTETDEVPMTEAPTVTETTGVTITETPAVGELPPQSQAAQIRPPERRDELTRLSALTGFQVIDRNGAVLGTASDYIVNTCETYIIYFVLEPDGSLGYAQGSRLVIPFEAVTINSGALDAQSRAIVLHLSLDQLSGAPAFPETLDLIPPDWEADVRAFFSQIIRLSNLTTECRVAAPGTDSSGGSVVVHKVAYATALLGTRLQDGLQNRLGTVEEAILEPESGKVSFFVVSFGDQQGLALVPLRVVNIPKEALEPGNELALELLTENAVLLNAPKIDMLEDAARGEAQNAARQYWNR